MMRGSEGMRLAKNDLRCATLLEELVSKNQKKSPIHPKVNRGIGQSNRSGSSS
jgi:hypothetical protein